MAATRAGSPWSRASVSWLTVTATPQVHLQDHRLPSAGMDQRLSLVTLAVEDLDRSTAFYQTLGWEPGFTNDAVTFFQLNGVVLSLYRRDLFAEELGVDEAELSPGGQTLAYNVREKDQVDEVVDQVSEAGGRVLVDPTDRDWGGRSGYVADPDGHRWEIAWNPGWSIGPDGDVDIAGSG